MNPLRIMDELEWGSVTFQRNEDGRTVLALFRIEGMDENSMFPYSMISVSDDANSRIDFLNYYDIKNFDRFTFLRYLIDEYDESYNKKFKCIYFIEGQEILLKEFIYYIQRLEWKRISLKNWHATAIRNELKNKGLLLSVPPKVRRT